MRARKVQQRNFVLCALRCCSALYAGFSLCHGSTIQTIRQNYCFLCANEGIGVARAHHTPSKIYERKIFVPRKVVAHSEVLTHAQHAHKPYNYLPSNQPISKVVLMVFGLRRNKLLYAGVCER